MGVGYQQQSLALTDPIGDRTEQDIQRRKRIAQTLMQQGMDASPVQHWLQGAARMAQGVVGGMNESMAARDQKALDDHQAAARNAAAAKQQFLDKEAASIYGGLVPQTGVMGMDANAIQQMLQNPQTRDEAQGIIMKGRMADWQRNQPPTEAERLDLEMKRAQIEALKAKPLASADSPGARAALAQQYGIDPNSDAGKSYILTGKLPREDQQGLTSTDKKAIFEAEDALPALDNTIAALNRAKKLNDKAYSGYTAGFRGNIGSKLPDLMVPDFIASKQGADDTAEFNNIMSFEAIKNMAATLKGATTDTELGLFVKLLGDPSTPPKVRGNIIDRMVSLSESQKAKSVNRMRSLADGTYYKPRADGGIQPAPSGMGGGPIRARNPQTGQTIEWDGNQWVPVQ